MYKLGFLLMVCCAVMGFSQKKPSTISIIDSITNSQWNQAIVDAEELRNQELTPIENHFNDTLFVEVKPVEKKVNDADDLPPITPFDLNNFNDPKKWYFYGQNDISFNQASFSNWNAGGDNNIGINVDLRYNLTYKNNRGYYEQLLELGYGWNSTKGKVSKKTEDVINYVFNYGYDLRRNYFLSAGFQFTSQFTPGYDFNKTPDPTYEDRISRFMAPGYFNFGVGVSYNPNSRLQFILRPVAAKLTYVADPLLQKAGRYGLTKDGQSLYAELGAMFNIVSRLKLHKGVYFDQQLGVFANYIDQAEKVDFNYSGILNIKYNKFINTRVSLDLVYDHDQVEKLQYKQTLNLGISYDFGKKEKPIKNDFDRFNHSKLIK